MRHSFSAGWVTSDLFFEISFSLLHGWRHIIRGTLLLSPFVLWQGSSLSGLTLSVFLECTVIIISVTFNSCGVCYPECSFMLKHQPMSCSSNCGLIAQRDQAYVWEWWVHFDGWWEEGSGASHEWCQTGVPPSFSFCTSMTWAERSVRALRVPWLVIEWIVCPTCCMLRRKRVGCCRRLESTRINHEIASCFNTGCE